MVEAAYGHAAGDIFLAAAPFGLLALGAVVLIREVPLRRSNAEPVPAGRETAEAVPAGTKD